MAVRLLEEPGGVRFDVKVVPGTSRDRIVGERGEMLKIAVRKPPRGGAANDAVRDLLARTLGVPRSAIQIVRGHGSARKQIRLAGLSATELADRLRNVDQSKS